MKNELKGLRAYIFRTPVMAQCSNGGISSRVDNVTIVAVRTMQEDGSIVSRPVPDDCQVFEPDEKAPAAVVVKRGRYVHIEPAEQPNGVGWMAGGSLVYGSDSRLRELLGHDYAVSLHDRQETIEQYRQLSSD